MAKSKSGGTRTYLRGRVGSDVYSIGRDSKGKKQQVVRSLAESVSNPQTQSQMRGRMILSTIAQALAVLRPIVDHSFDNVIGAQANLSEFTSRNYGLIKADIAAHPASGNSFGLVAYKEKGAKQGAYVISDGQATIPAALVLTKATGVIAITLPADNITIGGLKSALGMSSEEYFTLVGLTTAGSANYERFRVNPTLADNTVISVDNLSDVFAVEGNAVASVSIASNIISITLSSIAGDCAVIVSKKANGKYIHNEAQLGDGVGFSAPADTALPTYPVGNENYLNGGDIFGQQESFNPGGGDTPAPTPTESRISGVTINGAALTQTGQIVLNSGSNAAVIGINTGTDGESYGVAVIAKSAATIGGTVAAGQQTSVLGPTVNVSITGIESDPDKAIVLCKGTSIIQVWGTIKAPASPATTPMQITGVQMNGQAIVQNGSAALAVGTNTLTVTVAAGTDGKTYKLATVANSASQVGSAVDPSAGQTATAGANNINVTGVNDSPAMALVLVENNQVVQRWATLNNPVTPSGDSAAIATLSVDGNSVARGGDVMVDSANHATGTVTGLTQGNDYVVGYVNGNPTVGQVLTSINGNAEVTNNAFDLVAPRAGKCCLFLKDYDPNASWTYEVLDVYCTFSELDGD